MNPSTITGPSPDDLRSRMVDDLVASGYVRSSAVEAAMRVVPRHLLLPTAAIADAYADQAVTTKADDDGQPLSCASQPTVVAMMLEQLDVQPGHHVLEVGAGTGYNAALLAELVGSAGEVTTVDIYPDVVTQAREALQAAGHPQVRVVTGDGADGAPDHAPFDRIIVTVGPWDIPPAWTQQLAPDGRLVVPLHWRGQARSIAFVQEGDHLRSDSMQLCGFIPMLGQDQSRSGQIDPDGNVTLHWDDDQPIDTSALQGVLNQPKTTVWSDVTVGAEDPFDGIWLRLTASEPGACRIAAMPPAVDSGLCTPAIPARSPAIVEQSSLAYLTKQRATPAVDESRWTLGATGHGSHGADLARRIALAADAWGNDPAAQPIVTTNMVNPSECHLANGVLVDRPQARLVVSI